MEDLYCSDFQQFKEIVLEKLKDRYHDAMVSITSVTKNNGIVLDGLVIREDGRNISPTIYLQSFWRDKLDDNAIEKIVEQISTIYENHVGNEIVPASIINDIPDFEKIKDKIYYIIVNKAANKVLLKQSPHTEFLDLAVLYKISLTIADGVVGSILIKNEIFRMWDVTEKELFSIALDNTNKLFKPIILNIQDLLIEMNRTNGICCNEELDMMCQMEMEQHLLVVTNSEKINGAGIVFFNKDIQAELSKIFDGDFVIIPSSVHECICTNPCDTNVIKRMVHEVNETQVSKEEVLSNSVYFYNSMKKEIQIAI